jgi:hypothetical protein
MKSHINDPSKITAIIDPYDTDAPVSMSEADPGRNRSKDLYLTNARKCFEFILGTARARLVKCHIHVVPNDLMKLDLDDLLDRIKKVETYK